MTKAGLWKWAFLLFVLVLMVAVLARVAGRDDSAALEPASTLPPTAGAPLYSPPPVVTIVPGSEVFP